MASPINSFAVKHSFQSEKERNCGQHCVSMITGLPVAIIAEQIGHNRGTYLKDVTDTLRWFGYDCDVVETRWKGCDGLPELAILHIRQKWRGHWTVYFRGKIYDSCTGVWEFTEANLKLMDWKIKGFFKVEVPS